MPLSHMHVQLKSAWMDVDQWSFHHPSGLPTGLVNFRMHAYLCTIICCYCTTANVPTVIPLTQAPVVCSAKLLSALMLRHALPTEALTSYIFLDARNVETFSSLRRHGRLNGSGSLSGHHGHKADDVQPDSHGSKR